jgi:hypothetical protein
VNPPPWTIERERRLPGGRVEYLVRAEGGREVVLRLSSLAVALGHRDECIEQALARLRPAPGYYTT